MSSNQLRQQSMKLLKNTLYLELDNLWLARDGDTIDIQQLNASLKKIPIHILENIVCFGPISITPDAMDLCLKNGITINYLSVNGRFIARITGPVRGNVLLRRAQFRIAEQEAERVKLARLFLVGKIANARTFLMRHVREEKFNDCFKKTINSMASWLQELRDGEVSNYEKLMGDEGHAAVLYFSCFDAMILKNRDFFRFTGRTRRPPLDPVNALLSFGYSLLALEVTSALESVGLDPYVGFLHRDRPGRPSLALDLMEELRVPIVDRFALSLINMEQINPEHFIKRENGAVLLEEQARKKIFLSQWQARKRDMITHPFLKEKISFGLLPYCQAMLLARVIRGDLDVYPPFFLK